MRVARFFSLSSFFLIASIPGLALQTEAGRETPQDQTAVSISATRAVVPRMVRFSGAIRTGDGAPRSGVVSLTFSLYPEAQGGAPLWLETQNVTLDEQGRYTVVLGATTAKGLPMAIFATGEARWIGVRVVEEGAVEQSRVQLVSVPYALAAADALSLGGRPVSDFMLTRAAAATGGDASAIAPGSDPGVNSGTAGFIGKFTNTVDLVNSQMFDTGSNIGIGTASPTSNTFLHINGSMTTPAPTSFDAKLAKIDGTLLTNAQGQGYLFGLFVSPTYNTSAGYANIVFGIHVDSATRAGGNIAHDVVNYSSGALSKFNGSECVVGFGQDYPNQQTSLCNGIYGFYQGAGNVQYNYFQANTGFGGVVQPSQAIQVNGNILASGTITGANFSGSGLFALPTTTNSTTGVITSGGNRFIHNFGSNDTFLGVNSGNFTLTGNANTGTGTNSLTSLTSGVSNTATGFGTLTSATTGSYNTALGYNTLGTNTTGNENVAVGMQALQNNTTASFNTATGSRAMRDNTTGSNNTANGTAALFLNTTGNFNTASGSGALQTNSSGSENTAFGYSALNANTNGTRNTASGVQALYTNSSGFSNTASGEVALVSNTIGSANTANGDSALYANTSGNNNTAVGVLAGYTATAANANTTGSSNTFVGYRSGPGTSTQLSNATAIGANALVSASNTIVLGDSTVAMKVGIGTNTPTDSLHVNGGIRFGAGSFVAGQAKLFTSAQHGTLLTANTGSSNDIALVSASGNLLLTNPTGTNNLVMLSGGSFGVNTSNVSERLTVNGGIRFGPSSFSAGAPTLYQDAAHGSVLTGSQGTSNDLALVSRVGNLLLTNPTGTNNLVFFSGGNFGLNTFTPTTLLDVAGIIRSSTGGFKFPDNTQQTTAVPSNCSTNQIPKWSGTAWSCSADAGGAGTITGVATASSSGLTGGGTSGTLSLSLLTSCSSGQVLQWTGSQWACATSSGSGTVTSVAAGTGLTGGPITTSGTLAIDTAVVARIGVNNNFTTTQNITGNLLVSGNASVFGTLTKGAGSFKIDHPLDPSGKYLSHSFVESPDMKNVYDGLVTLDQHGEAWVQLPDYFDALNRDFRYQLTSVGRFAPVYIAQKVSGNRFKISGGRSGMEVSWQITGIRQDAYANAHRIPTEEPKLGTEKGTYLHPELFEQPAQGSNAASIEKRESAKQKSITH